MHLKTLFTLALTNAKEGRLSGRDVFARGAVNAAEMSRPDEETLARVDDTGTGPADQY